MIFLLKSKARNPGNMLNIFIGSVHSGQQWGTREGKECKGWWWLRGGEFSTSVIQEGQNKSSDIAALEQSAVLRRP